MLQDVEHGCASSWKALVGSVVELAASRKTPTLTIEAIYAATSSLAQTLAAQKGRLEAAAAGLPDQPYVSEAADAVDLHLDRAAGLHRQHAQRGAAAGSRRRAPASCPCDRRATSSCGGKIMSASGIVLAPRGRRRGVHRGAVRGRSRFAITGPNTPKAVEALGARPLCEGRVAVEQFDRRQVVGAGVAEDVLGRLRGASRLARRPITIASSPS